MGRGVEGDGQRISRRLWAEPRAWLGAQSHNPEIMTWAETKSQTLNQLSHPGAPPYNLWDLYFTVRMYSMWADEPCSLLRKALTFWTFKHFPILCWFSQPLLPHYNSRKEAPQDPLGPPFKYNIRAHYAAPSTTIRKKQQRHLCDCSGCKTTE